MPGWGTGPHTPHPLAIYARHSSQTLTDMYRNFALCVACLQMSSLTVLKRPLRLNLSREGEKGRPRETSLFG